MTLQEILKMEKHKWIMLCNRNKIDRWEIIRETKDPVYFSGFYIADSERCLLCEKQLTFGFSKGAFHAKLTCDCVKDTPKIMNLKRLRCFVPVTEAERILKELNAKKTKKMREDTSKEFWIEQGLTEEAAIAKILEINRSRSARCPEYWAKKGLSAEDISIQLHNFRRLSSSRCKEFWINRGLTEEEAKEKVIKIQTTNGLDIYKEKFGDSLGEQKFNERIKSWLNSENMKKVLSGRSKVSLKLFESLDVLGKFGNNEVVVRGKTKSHRVDYKFQNKIIEFYGDYWHGTPKKYSSEDIVKNKKVQDIWDRDQFKCDDLRNAGFELLVIWEGDYVRNPEETIKLCRRFLNENNS